MSKVLIMGDAGVSTGFGVVTNNIGNRLVERGHEVHVLAARWQGDPHLTKMEFWRADLEDPLDTYGKKRVVEILSRVEPDVVFILNDPHVICRLMFANDFDPEQALRRYRPVITYFTVDGDNLPEAWKVFSRHSTAVAMSRFGQDQVPGSEMLYHGVDTETFRPATQQRPIKTSSGHMVFSKRHAKQAIGYDPNRFLILRVDRNGWRKDFGSTWKALVPVVAEHDDIDVHFHCAGNDMAGGPMMPALFSRDMATAERFKLSKSTKLATDDLVVLLNAADMVVSTSMGEGFGLTLAETIACGVPVVAQNISAIPEVVGPGALLIPPGPVITSPSGQDLRIADTEAFTKAIDLLYRDGELRAELEKQGLEHVKRFSWDDTTDGFDGLIRGIA